MEPNSEPFPKYIFSICQFQVLTMIVIFCLTLAAGVVAKGATFFMVSQIGKNVIQKACPENFGYFSYNINGEISEVELTETEKVGWIWAIFFCFLAGEFYTLVRCTRTILMKSYRKEFCVCVLDNPSVKYIKILKQYCTF